MSSVQEEIIQVVRDYVKSGDNVSVVARRNGVKPSALSAWLKKSGLLTKRTRVNWGKVKEEALK